MPEGARVDPRHGGDDSPVQPPTPELQRALEVAPMAYPTCQMPPEKWQDYWRYYDNALDAHRSAVWTLYDQIRALPGGCDVLNSSALWVQKWNEKPPEPTWPVVFNPWGPDEQGMAGPKIQIKLNKNDTCLVVNDKTEKMKAYDAYGTLLWTANCLARGQGSDYDWKTNSSDTPPGAYKAGVIYRDYDQYGSNPAYSGTLQSYGWYSIDMIELENQEAANGRAGIMAHGGGSACGWPGAWKANQTLYPTLGCIRAYNIDLRDKIVPLADKGILYFAVFQEAR
jgi:hypothetical protein